MNDAEQQLEVASAFIRQIIEAIGFAQPDPRAVISLDELRLQVVGLIEDQKHRLAARSDARVSDADLAHAIDAATRGFNPLYYRIGDLIHDLALARGVDVDRAAAIPRGPAGDVVNVDGSQR